MRRKKSEQGICCVATFSHYCVYIIMGDQLKLFPDRENLFFLAGSIVKLNDTWIDRKEKTNYTKCEVTGDLHCISLPLKFLIERQNHETVPESVTWYGRLVRLRTNLDTRFTNIFLDYSTQKTHQYECHTEEQKTVCVAAAQLYRLQVADQVHCSGPAPGMYHFCGGVWFSLNKSSSNA